MLNQTQKDWLDIVEPASTKQGKAVKLEFQRSEARARLVKRLEESANTLLGQMNIQATRGKESLAFAGLQEDAFDLDDLTDGYTLSDEDLQKHERAMKAALDIMNEAAGETALDTDENGNKVRLFDETELRDEVYRPLVRSRLMPETFVPDKVSDTRTMLDASFSAYGDRLLEEGIKSKFSENRALLTSGAKLLLSGVSGGMAMKASMSADPVKALDKWGKADTFFKDLGKDIDKRADLAGMCFEASVVVFEGGEAIAERFKDEGSDAPTWAKQPSAVVAACATSFTAGFAAPFADVDAKLTRTLTTRVGAALNGAALAKALFAAAGQETLTLEGEHGTAVATAMTVMFGAVEKGLTAPGLTDVAAAAKRDVESTLKTEDLVRQLHDDNIDKLLQLIGQRAEAIGRRLIKANRDALTNGAGDLQAEADKDIRAEFQRAEQEQREAEKRELQEIEQARAKGVSDTEFRGLLKAKIGKLAAFQERLKWVTTVMSQGIAFAAKAFAPLAIAGNLLSLAKNIYEAANRMRDLTNWVEKQIDMIRAASEFEPALARFADDAAIQSMHYMMAAACDAVKLIGSILDSTGILAPAGQAVGAVGSVAGALESFLYEVKKRYDLEAAWKSYRLAIVRKENRRIGLQAIRKNPTLAKYAVAWGAIIKRDSLVVDFMTTCGLNEETLKDPDANLNLVVQYLELRMPDDNVVVGRGGSGTPWAPQPFAVGLAWWSKAQAAGVKADALEDERDPSVEKALARAGQAYTALEKKHASGVGFSDPERTDLLERLTAAVKTLHEHRPRRAGGDLQHAGMKKLCGEYAGFLNETVAEVKEWVSTEARNVALQKLKDFVKTPGSATDLHDALAPLGARAEGLGQSWAALAGAKKSTLTGILQLYLAFRKDCEAEKVADAKDELVKLYPTLTKDLAELVAADLVDTAKRATTADTTEALEVIRVAQERDAKLIAEWPSLPTTEPVKSGLEKVRKAIDDRTLALNP